MNESGLSSFSVQDIAERAGVSTATVSRVLNQSELVRPKTRAKVEAVIAEFGYQPNALARNLRTAESRMLLTMVPDFGNPFYAEIVRGIDAYSRSKGYHVLLCDTGADASAEGTYFDMVRHRLADGAICLDPDSIQHGISAEMKGLNWVACCEYDPDANIPYVGIDNEKAACDAVTYLIGQGCKNIALINSDKRYRYARDRNKGYEAALSKAGLKKMQQKFTSGLEFDNGHRAATELLKGSRKPDAIFAVSDTLAIGAIRAVRDAGLSVPHDVRVMGFDNIPIATIMEPQLSTVAQPMRELGETAARLLIDRLRNPLAKTGGILLKHELVLRQSA